MKIKKYQKPSGPLPKKSFWWNLANQLQSAPSNGETTIAAHNADLNRQVEQARKEAINKGENPNRAEEETYKHGLLGTLGGLAVGNVAVAAPQLAKGISEASKFMTTPVGKTVLKKALKETGISVLGGTAVDKLSEATTGMSFGKWAVGSIPGARDLYDRSGIARFGIDMLNPGYLGLSGSKALISGTANTINNAVEHIAPIQIRRIQRSLPKVFGENSEITIAGKTPVRWKHTFKNPGDGSYQNNTITSRLWTNPSITAHEVGHHISAHYPELPEGNVMGAYIPNYRYGINTSPEQEAAEAFADYFRTKAGWSYKGKDLAHISRQRAVTNNLGDVQLYDVADPGLLRGKENLSLKEIESAWEQAVAKGDMSEAQRLSDLHGIIKAGGKEPLIGYRGEKAHNASKYTLGSTHRPNISFATTEPAMASSYAEVYTPYSKAYGLQKQLTSDQNIFKLRKENGIAAEEENLWIDKIQDLKNRINTAIKEQENFSHPQLRKLHIYSENPTEVDVKGSLWSHVGKYDPILGKFPTTDDLAIQAQNNGYDALVIKNVRDTGNSNIFFGRNSATDIVSLNTKRTKLADAITYDDAGNIIPLSKRHDFNNPDIRYDLPRFAGKSVDTTNPTVRQTLVQKYSERYPQFQQTPEKEFVTSGDGYYEVGKIPFTEDLKLHKDLIRRRLDNFNSGWRSEYGYYTDPTTHMGNMYSGESILNKAGENGITVVVPKERNGQFGGFYNSSGSRAGESFTTADAWRSKPVRFTQLHESVSHPTDMFVRDIKSDVSGKSVRDLYNRVTQPSDLFPDFKNFFKHDASELWYEGRSTNNEMIKRVNEIVSKKTGKRLPEVYNNPELLEAYVDTNLKTNEQLVSFLESMDNGYLADYASLLKAKAGTKEANVYANRIRNMIKILFGVSVPIAVASKQK